MPSTVKRPSPTLPDTKSPASAPPQLGSEGAVALRIPVARLHQIAFALRRFEILLHLLLVVEVVGDDAVDIRQIQGWEHLVEVVSRLSPA